MPATIFLSAASLDLEKRRDDLHAVFSGGGLRVLTQGHSFGLAPRDVRDLLVRRIAESDFVCHLAGLGYGAHADHRFPGAQAEAPEGFPGPVMHFDVNSGMSTKGAQTSQPRATPHKR